MANKLLTRVLPEMYTTSVWRTQAIHAIIHDPRLNVDIQKHIETMTVQLSKILSIFIDPTQSNTREAFKNSLREQVIEPTVDLFITMISERNVYSLTLDKYLPGLDDPEGATASERFYRDLDDLECLVVKAKRHIPLDKAVKPGVSIEERRNGLSRLCTLTPALKMQQISDTDCICETKILKKQKILVLWEPDFTGDEEETFFQELQAPYGGSGLWEWPRCMRMTM